MLFFRFYYLPMQCLWCKKDFSTASARVNCRGNRTSQEVLLRRHQSRCGQRICTHCCKDLSCICFSVHDLARHRASCAMKQYSHLTLSGNQTSTKSCLTDDNSNSSKLSCIGMNIDLRQRNGKRSRSMNDDTDLSFEGYSYPNSTSDAILTEGKLFVLYGNIYVYATKHLIQLQKMVTYPIVVFSLITQTSPMTSTSLPTKLMNRVIILTTGRFQTFRFLPMKTFPSTMVLIMKNHHLSLLLST